MALLTQKAIMQAFRDMLREQPFDKITVSALVKRAGVSPNTFYYHYQDIYALLNTYIKAVADKYRAAAEREGWETASKALLRECRENSDIVYHIFNSLSRDRLERYVFTSTDDVFSRMIGARARGRRISEEELWKITSFCRYAYVGFTMQYLWRGMTDDIDESVDSLAAVFNNFVDRSIELYDGEK